MRLAGWPCHDHTLRGGHKVIGLEHLDRAGRAHLHQNGVRSCFGVWVDQDDKKSTEYITTIWQGGLGLPDRDYYFRDDERSVKIRGLRSLS